MIASTRVIAGSVPLRRRRTYVRGDNSTPPSDQNASSKIDDLAAEICAALIAQSSAPMLQRVSGRGAFFENN